MKVSMDMDRLIDFMIEWFSANFDYCKSSRDYQRKHHHGVYFDDATPLTKEEKHIRYVYHYEAETWQTIHAIMDVLQMNGDARERLYCAGRAVKNWYERTGYERCLPHDVCDRITNYVFAE